MSTFDPATFLNQTIDSANDTKVIPVPASEYLAIATKVDIKPWAKKDGSESGLKLEIIWEVQDENVKALIGREPTVKQDQMLDLTAEGGLETGSGKNVGLGRIREALGLNTPGEPFAFSMIQGRMAKIMVSHRINGEDVYAEVKKIASAS